MSHSGPTLLPSVKVEIQPHKGTIIDDTSLPMDMFGLDEEGLFDLVFNLLYPVVLGAVLITYVRTDLPAFVQTVARGQIAITPRLYFGLVFIFHWSLLYTVYNNDFDKPQFRLASFVAYSLVSLFMLSAFHTMPEPGSEGGYLYFYLSVSGIGGTFAALDLYRRHDTSDRGWSHPTPENRGELVIDSALFLWGLGFAIGHVSSSAVAGNAGVAYLFITGTLAASLLTLREFG